MSEYVVEVLVKDKVTLSCTMYDNTDAQLMAHADPADIHVRVYKVDTERHLIGVAASKFGHLPSPPDEDEHVDGRPT